MARSEILLESGTNEVEILEFLLGSQGFGVNVVKIQAIERFDSTKLTAMPKSHPGMAGMLLFRNRTIPLIDLSKELNIKHAGSASDDSAGDGEHVDTRIVLVMEFNHITCAVLADGVNRIHRIGWGEISPLSSLIADQAAAFTGSVHIDEREILIVDMEKIVAEILPEARIEDLDASELEHPKASDRSQVKIILAEDSATIRSMITSVLKKGNYSQITAFDNGKSAFEMIQALQEHAREEGVPLSDLLSMVVTDIEMPQMDGLALCKNIRQTLGLQDLPVVMFSSLINDQMAAKCKSVGADGTITKPQIANLIHLVDELCLEKAETAMTAGAC